jgi:hypothetical protein
MTQTLQRLQTAPNRYPLSYPQQVWCERADSGAFGPRFTVSRGFRITGQLDLAALQAALDDVVYRHEMLRTVIVHQAEPPYQEVHPPCRVPLRVRQLPNRPGLDRQLCAEQVVAEAETTSLDVLDLPLVRAVLARFDDNDAVLALTLHHVACDGWSLQLVLRDLASCYAARVAGGVPVLPPAPQYREFALWQQRQLAGPEAVKSLSYWRDVLAGGGIFALPTDRPVSAEHTQPYAERSFTIDAAVISELTRFAKQAHCSMFMTVLASFNAFAYRLTGTTDPMIGTTIHGRGQPEFVDTVGPLINMLPLRTRMADCLSFRELVLQTRMTCLDGFCHDLPIHVIEQAAPYIADPLADPGNSDLTFGFFESPFDPGLFRLGQATVEVRNRNRKTPQNPGGAAWNMAIRPSGELYGCLEYSPDEFDASTIDGWVADYCRLVEAAAADPERDWRTLG